MALKLHDLDTGLDCSMYLMVFCEYFYRNNKLKLNFYFLKVSFSVPSLCPSPPSIQEPAASNLHRLHLLLFYSQMLLQAADPLSKLLPLSGCCHHLLLPPQLLHLHLTTAPG